MFGLLNVNKSAGVTSRDVVNAVERLLPPKTKVGHAGTLDPMATGVLVLCVGSATRLVPYVQEQRKSYVAGVRLGCRSDTDDATGTIVETPDARLIEESELRSALRRFEGRISQTPPQYSALRVEGKRAYDLARAGVTVDLAPREIEVSRIELHRCDGRDLELSIDCSSGTYIRSIARDLGEILGIGGLMTGLVRTGVGLFRVEDAHPIEHLQRESIHSRLLSPVMAVPDHPSIVLTDDEATAVRQGKKLPLRDPCMSGPMKAVTGAGDLVALGDAEGGVFHPRMVFGAFG